MCCRWVVRAIKIEVNLMQRSNLNSWFMILHPTIKFSQKLLPYLWACPECIVLTGFMYDTKQDLQPQSAWLNGVLPPNSLLTILIDKIWNPHTLIQNAFLFVLRTALHVLTLKISVFPKPLSNISARKFIKKCSQTSGSETYVLQIS